VVKYLGYSENIASKGYDGINLSNYKVIILQNSGTASASEIMI
jgi:C-terminal processing protease CtpA/Prc